YRPPARRALTLGVSAIALVVVAFVAYALFGIATGSHTLYGGQLGELNTKTTFKLGQFLAGVWNFYLEKVATLERFGPRYGYRQVFIEGFYGGFGSGNVSFPGGVITTLQIFSGVGLAALLAAVVARWRQLRRAWPVLAVTLGLLLISLVFLHYTNYRALLTRGAGHLFAGRYLLETIGLFALAITFTVSSLARRMGPLVGAVILGFAAALCLTGIGVSMFRFYG
ncbi:MAG TPA: hypothetical protein VNZ05_04265, partial [Solirubrobacteraceae bacterium]|nr:hypothetical protein [Solirubrobacteraceae bacterium]